MGVVGLLSFLFSNFQHVFKPVYVNIPSSFDHGNSYFLLKSPVSVDLNSLLHECGKKTWHEAFVIQRAFEKLDDIVTRFPPKKSLHIVLDGPGPSAKWKTQIERRTNKETIGKGFDLLQLCPGTVFITRLKEALYYYACNILKRKELSKVTVEIDGADTPGEGELKIINYVYRLESLNPNSKDTYAIASNDSDLLLLGLCTLNERVHVLTHDRKRIFSTELFYKELEKFLPGQSRNIALDFTLIAFLTGNDYLPCITDFYLRKLWKRYRTLKETKYPSSFLLKSLQEINEEFLMDIIRPDVYGNGKEEEDERKEEGAQRKSQESEKVSKTNSNLLNAKVQHYLEGLLWNMSMYFYGNCPFYGYYYFGKYKAPSTKEIIEYFEQLGGKIPKVEWKVDLPLSPACFAMLLLPSWGREHLASPLQKLELEFDTDAQQDFTRIVQRVNSIKEQIDSIPRDEFSEEENNSLDFSAPRAFWNEGDSKLDMEIVTPIGLATPNTTGIKMKMTNCSTSYPRNFPSFVALKKRKERD